MSRRVERLNSLLRQEICDLLRRGVKDPRLGGFVTVTQVSISPDLRHARILISVIGSEEEKKTVLQALTSASGFLRKEIGNRLRMRYSPELSFRYDDSIDQGAQVLQLMSQMATTEAGENEPSEC